MDRPVDICLHHFPERAAHSSPVRSNITNVVTYLTIANIDVAPGPFSTSV